ncbi:MAG TPA: cob(I)yrinic acid a,c-diamide adenosyltransferase [Candidatus Thermoplasmatota archaeon]|nr:cob(I)yrinic acid a,c-diamide adenosyltransferase [Candidatus Thermoplasmatota archaeon]
MAGRKERFKEPRVGIGKVYTRTGDGGETGLVGGQRVPKDDVRIEAYGAVDELNSWIGLARAAALDSGPAVAPFAATLLGVQHRLFNLGSILATLPADQGPRQPRTTATDIQGLEREMDRRTAKLPALKSFVLPGGSRLNALLHLARTVCRRAERNVVTLRRQGGCGDLEVQYLNRLSDALFVWSRWASRELGQPEVLWDPNG